MQKRHNGIVFFYMTTFVIGGMGGVLLKSKLLFSFDSSEILGLMWYRHIKLLFIDA